MIRPVAYRMHSVAGGEEQGIGLAGAALAAVIAPPGDRADRRAGTIALRAAAAAAAAAEPDELEIVHRPEMPPAALRMGTDGRLRKLSLSLSVSHRLGRAIAVACARTLRIGIDLERHGAVPPGGERLYLARSELRLLERHEPEALWALKEAAWKALRLERWHPFRDLELVCDRTGVLRALRSPAGEHDARAALWRPWPRFVAALVWLP